MILMLTTNQCLMRHWFAIYWARNRKGYKGLKNNKSPSIFDNIINEYLKNAPANLLAVLKLFFNIILDSGIFPDVWSKGVILPLYKNKGDVNDPDNYRGITILSCFGKLFTSVLNNRLNDFLESNNILCEEQAGFRKHYSTVDHIFSLKLQGDVYLAHGKKLYCVRGLSQGLWFCKSHYPVA